MDGLDVGLLLKAQLLTNRDGLRRMDEWLWRIQKPKR